MTDPAVATPPLPEAGRKAGSLGRNTAIMASGTAVSRVLGFVRNAMLVAAIGVNAGAANAYEVANKIPNGLYAVLAAGVLNAALVPQIVRAFQRADGKRTVDRILTIGGVISLAATLIFTAGAAILVRIYSDNWTPELIALATAFALWCIPQLFFYGIYTLLGQVLNAREQFGPFMWAPALNNVVGIAGLAAYLAIFGAYALPDAATSASETALVDTWTPGRIALLAGVATLGIAAQALILLWPLLKGGYRPRWVWRGPTGELRGVRTVATWALGAVVVEQVAVALTSRVATAANPGDLTPEIAGNAAYYDALIVFLVPHSLVTVSIITALFVSMSRLASEHDWVALRHELSRGVRVIGVFTVFASVALAVLAPFIMRVVLPTASPIVIDSVAEVLMVLSLGLIPLGAMVLMKYLYFALEDAKSIFIIHVPMAIAWVGVAYAGRAWMEPRWWAVSVAAGYVASNIIAVALRLAGLRRKLGGLDGRRVAITHLKALFAVIPAGLGGWIVAMLAPGLSELEGATGVAQAALTCAVAGAVMLMLYVAVLRLLRVEELADALAPATRRLRRRVR